MQVYDDDSVDGTEDILKPFVEAGIVTYRRGKLETLVTVADVWKDAEVVVGGGAAAAAAAVLLILLLLLVLVLFAR